jgi:hypothetical protein
MDGSSAGTLVVRVVGLGISVVSSLFIVGVTGGMIYRRKEVVVRTRRVWWITGHSVSAVLWIGLGSVRSIGVLSSVCNSPLDAVQLFMQCTWVSIWVLRVRDIVCRVEDIQSCVSTKKQLASLLALVWFPWCVLALTDAVAVRCDVTWVFVVLLALSSQVHLLVLLRTSVALMSLHAPYKIGGGVLVVIFIATNFLITVASLAKSVEVGSLDTDTAHALSAFIKLSQTVSIALIATMFHAVQCKPILVRRDNGYDPVMQQVGRELLREACPMTLTTDAAFGSPEDMHGCGAHGYSSFQGMHEENEQDVEEEGSLHEAAEQETLPPFATPFRTTDRHTFVTSQCESLSTIINGESISWSVRSQGISTNSLISVLGIDTLSSMFLTNQEVERRDSFLFVAKRTHPVTVRLLCAVDDLMMYGCASSSRALTTGNDHFAPGERDITASAENIRRTFLLPTRLYGKLKNSSCILNEFRPETRGDIQATMHGSLRVNLWFRVLERELEDVCIRQYRDNAVMCTQIADSAEARHPALGSMFF